MQPPELFQHAFKHDAHLQACQGRAKAEMDAMPEGLVTVRVAPDVKPFRIGELLLIKVRREPVDLHLFPFAYELLAEIHISFRYAPLNKVVGASAKRRHVAQNLFNRARGQFRFAPQPLQLLRTLVKAEEHIAQHIGRSNVSGDKKREAEGHQILVAQALSLDFRSAEQAENISARLFAMVIDGLREAL